MPARWLRIIGNYTHDDSRVVTSPNAFDPALLPGNHLLRRPVDSGSVSLLAAWKNITGSFAGYFSGERTDSDFLFLGLPPRTPATRGFDLSTSYIFWSRRKYVCAGAESFRQAISGCAGVPGARREVRVGMNYRFGGKR